MKRSISLLSIVSLFAVACSQSPVDPSRSISASVRASDCAANGSTGNNSNNPPETAGGCNNNNNNNNNTNNDNNPPATAKP